MKTRGFTLIELLSVIVILAIIALIAVPIIINIIGSSKESTQKRSLELYKSAVEQAVARYNLNNTTPLSNGDYTPNNDGTLLTLNETNKFKVSYSGNVVKCNVNLNEGNATLSNCIIDGSIVKNDIIADANQGETGDPSRDLISYARFANLENDTIQTIEINGETYTAHVYNFEGNQVWSENKTFGTATDVATATEDASNIVIVKVNGNLTINEGVKVTTYGTEYGGPKGFYLCVTGTLTNNGTITMTARGAKAEGQDVYLYQNSDGTYEYVPAVGASGGASDEGTTSAFPGSAGTNRSTGGGGGGAHGGNGSKRSGAGSAGTSYSGGSGGGGAYHVSISGTPKYNGGSASANGGAGGYGAIRAYAHYVYASGGAGNPAGQGAFSSSSPGNDYANDITQAENGTGGLLILYAKTLKNNGVISSNGSNVYGKQIHSVSRHALGGASGGGSVNIFTRSIQEYGTITANGGVSNYISVGTIEYSCLGGSGGNGSVSIGVISTNEYMEHTLQE